MPSSNPASRRGMPPARVDEAIKAVVARYRINAFQGNCGNFAIALNMALGGQGTYLAADSGAHYEYVDHIALKFRGRIYDGDGLITRDAFREYARDEDDGFADATIFEVEENDVHRMVDGGAMGDDIDVDLTAERLRAALVKALGWAPPEPPEDEAEPVAPAAP